MERVETVVIGAGQAGLAASWHLGRLGCEHVVLERSRVAERWRGERWDSLMFQFPNWTIALPGLALARGDPDGFSHKDDIVRFLEDYRVAAKAPVRTAVAVRSLAPSATPGSYVLATDAGAIVARNVVVATGPYQRPHVPAIAADFPGTVVHVHARDYRNPATLPEGAVLVVGTGASGCQIAEELAAAGRRTLLAVGRHRRIPRRYRGRDVIYWRRELGDLDRLATAIPIAQRQPPPLVTGVGGGHDVDLRELATSGVILLGHIRGCDGRRIRLAPELRERLAEGDRAYAEFVARVDMHIARVRLDAPAAPGKPRQAADDPESVDAIDIAAEGIRSVIWATGYRLDLGWVRLPIFDADGQPMHRDGVTPAPGIYLLGLSWLRKQKSSFLFGVGEDAQFIAGEIAHRSRGR
jgi:putative flavoprotein involved in K+ transport